MFMCFIAILFLGERGRECFFSNISGNIGLVFKSLILQTLGLLGSHNFEVSSFNVDKVFVALY